MFGRVMVAVGGLSALGMAAVGVLGYRGVAKGAGLREHVLLGLATLLLFVLAHAWVAFYLVGAARVLGGAAMEGGRAPEPPVPAVHRSTLPPLLLAVAAALATFVVGSAVHTGAASAGLHGALLWLTLLLQTWAGRAEWRAVTAVSQAAGAVGR